MHEPTIPEQDQLEGEAGRSRCHLRVHLDRDLSPSPSANEENWGEGPPRNAGKERAFWRLAIGEDDFSSGIRFLIGFRTVTGFIRLSDPCYMPMGLEKTPINWPGPISPKDKNPPTFGGASVAAAPAGTPTALRQSGGYLPQLRRPLRH